MYDIHSAIPRFRSALLLGRIALLFTFRRALPARRLTALGARAALSTDFGQPADKNLPAFERRCIRAGPLRSALLLGRIALLFTFRRALPAPAPHRSRCSGGLIHGLWAARGQEPPGIRAAMHPRWTASLCVAPRANSAAIHLSSRLASPAPHRSRCSGGLIHGLWAARGQEPPGIRAAMHPRWTASLCVAPRANSAAIHLSSRLASPAPHRSRCSGGLIHGLRAT